MSSGEYIIRSALRYMPTSTQVTRPLSFQSRQQARVPATVAQAFERDEGVSDGEGDGVTLLHSAAQLPPSGQAEAETLPGMLQQQLDAINEEIRWVCPNSAPQKLGFSEQLSFPRSLSVPQ